MAQFLNGWFWHGNNYFSCENERFCLKNDSFWIQKIAIFIQKSPKFIWKLTIFVQTLRRSWIITVDTVSLIKTKIFRLLSSQQIILWLKRHILCHFRLPFRATGPRIMNTHSKMASALILSYPLGVQIINQALDYFFIENNSFLIKIFFRKFTHMTVFWTKIRQFDCVWPEIELFRPKMSLLNQFF